MANKDNEQQPVIGWFQPHRAVNWDGLVADPKTGELVKEQSMTKQSFKDECDINNIVRDFTKTGMVTHVNERAHAGAFVDLPNTIDFQMGLEMVRAAELAFEQLPAQVRAQFGNDPAAFLTFMEDASPEAQQRKIDMGFATDNRPPPPPADVKPRAQAPGSSSSSSSSSSS